MTLLKVPKWEPKTYFSCILWETTPTYAVHFLSSGKCFVWHLFASSHECLLPLTLHSGDLMHFLNHWDTHISTNPFYHWYFYYVSVLHCATDYTDANFQTAQDWLLYVQWVWNVPRFSEVSNQLCLEFGSQKAVFLWLLSKTQWQISTAHTLVTGPVRI